MNIGEIIRSGLHKKRIKVKDLANMLGVGSTAVSQWLSGNSTPPGDKMIKIIEILDLVDDFFPNRDNEVKNDPYQIDSLLIDDLAVEVRKLMSNQTWIMSEYRKLNKKYNTVCSELDSIKKNEKPT